MLRVEIQVHLFEKLDKIEVVGSHFQAKVHTNLQLKKEEMVTVMLNEYEPLT